MHYSDNKILGRVRPLPCSQFGLGLFLLSMIIREILIGLTSLLPDSLVSPLSTLIFEHARAALEGSYICDMGLCSVSAFRSNKRFSAVRGLVKWWTRNNNNNTRAKDNI